ncbi:MAG: RagB/SusD family nutrient uptake outer membrane protein [Bacteroidales bacterium]|nr:RagB/SusD family nutrient uptake outer membrane protein [Bacteroidales bacterium]
MKSIKFVLFLLLAVMTSCESIIQETVYTKTEKNFFLNESDALSAITAVYAQMYGYDSFGRYGWQVLEGAGVGMTNSKPQSDTGAFFWKENTSTNQVSSHIWQNAYTIIAYANNVIENVPGMNIDPNVRNSVTGEALYMRGMVYFTLVRMWGAVPLKLSSTKGFGDPGIRQSESVVYAQIIKDLMLAGDLLPKTQALKGRATKGAAYGMLAKVYLTAASMKKHSGNAYNRFDFVTNEQAYYDSARVYCQKVTDLGVYSLVPDFMKQFPMQVAPNGTVKEEGFENSVESIFEIQYDRNDKYMSTDLPMQVIPYIKGGGYTYNDLSWGSYRITKTLFNDFYAAHSDTTTKEVDYRIDVTFLGGATGILPTYKKGILSTTVGDTLYVYPYSPRPAVNLAERWPYLAKYQDFNAIASNQHGANFIILRYADVLLMQAEAENELGDKTNALTHVNMLMARARKADGKSRSVPKDFTAALSQNDLRLAIWAERRYEFVGEAHMWYDLVRTGQYQSYLEHYKVEEYDKNPVVECEMKYYPRNILFPIPLLEINSNDKVTQNPGHV